MNACVVIEAVARSRACAWRRPLTRSEYEMTMDAGIRWRWRADAWREEALQASEEQLSTPSTESGTTRLFMMDPHGPGHQLERRCGTNQGVPSRRIIGQNFSCFFLPEDIARGRSQEFLRLAAARRGRHEEQGLRVRKNGSRFLARVTFTALRDAAGQSSRVFRIQPRSQRKGGVGGEISRLAGSGPGAMVVVKPGGEIVLLNGQAGEAVRVRP